MKKTILLSLVMLIASPLTYAPSAHASTEKICTSIACGLGTAALVSGIFLGIKGLVQKTPTKKNNTLTSNKYNTLKRIAASAALIGVGSAILYYFFPTEFKIHITKNYATNTTHFHQNAGDAVQIMTHTNTINYSLFQPKNNQQVPPVTDDNWFLFTAD